MRQATPQELDVALRDVPGMMMVDWKQWPRQEEYVDFWERLDTALEQYGLEVVNYPNEDDTWTVAIRPKEKQQTEESPDYILQQAIKPEWEKVGRVHDWRNYISDEIAEMWDSFTVTQRIALVNAAEESARKEEWD